MTTISPTLCLALNTLTQTPLFQSNTVFAEFANLEALENAKLKLNGLALGGETLSAESAKSNRNIATDIEMDR